MINLYAYQDILKLVLLKQRQIEQLQDTIKHITPILTGMPGSKTDYTDSLAKMLDLQAELANDIKDMIKALAEIEAVINSLPVGRVRNVLYSKYVLGYTIERIAVDMHYSYWHVQRLKRDGLNWLNKNMVKNIATL